VRDALVYGPQAIQPPDPGWPKEWALARSSEERGGAAAWRERHTYNAEAFGGDPGNVMIWRESGGGAKTATTLRCAGGIPTGA
jgi:hypothetical protein